MRTKSFAIALTAALPLLTLAACKPHEQAETQAQTDQAPAPEATPGEIAGTNNNNPNDVSAMKAQSWIDDVTVGKKVGADGTIAEADQSDDFVPGDAIHVTMKVGDAPAGSQVKVVWYGPGETKIDESTKTVNAGDHYLAFESGSTASWAKGDYRAEVWIGDEKVNTQQFNIVDAKDAAH